MADLLSAATASKPDESDNTNREAASAGPNTKPDAGHATVLDTLFAELGGASSVARILGVGQSTASEMKRRRSIPIEHWPALIQSEAGKALALDERALLFAHTGVDIPRVGKAVVVTPTPPKEDDDPEAKVRWSSEDEFLVFNLQPATRIYRNNFGQVVICQEARDVGDDDPFVFFEITNVPKLIAAIQREAKNG